MDYFRIVNLKREPFSNTPDPDMFYPSHIHLQCLQKLELAVRLKRGLNVVLGEVGTGKTTLCRKLIQQISTTQGNDAIELHLVLDPFFSSADEFLSVIMSCFELSASYGAMTDRNMKESIKNYLFAKGVEEGKIVALLIDEGQKLPDFCLEILREFLNYETNDSKLLQIVIFAQLEFRKKIDELPNFANRINLCYSLKPLGFRETSRMIAYRINQTSVNEKGRALFTWPGLFALYRATGGIPRSINTLCHHVLIALIIQDGVKAGRSLVLACTDRIVVGPRRKMNLRPALMIMALAASLLLLALTYYGSVLNSTSTIGGPLISGLRSRFFQPVMGEVESAPATDTSPPILGQLSLEKGADLRKVFRDIYGPDNTGLFSKLVKANPHINNSHIVQAGEVVVIPALPATPDRITKKVFIQVASARTLKEAYNLLRSYSGSAPDMMLFPFWNHREGMVFALLLTTCFTDRTAAQEAMKRLSPALLREVKVLDTWDTDTIFYHNLNGDKR